MMINKDTASKFFRGAHNLRVVMRQVSCPNGFCLIIEDDENVAQYLIKVFSKLGMESKVVDNSIDAMEVISRDSKHIICAIVDLNLVFTPNAFQKSHHEHMKDYIDLLIFFLLLDTQWELMLME